MALADPPSPRAWWKSAVVYQIYPISFFDSNGDGFGDLNGILAKLEYLKDLGVDVLWLSPIYKSPLADMGYDIADYQAIDPRYGTLEDWDRLIAAVHERGMKLMMDLVVNHTSDEHEWFVQSRSDKDASRNPKRDWYIWRPPKYDEQGSAWDYDEKTGEYYLHLYVSKQPDLNWENPAVREAVYEMMEWWIKRGCDGFRMDVINIISKVDGLPDAPVTDPKEEYQSASIFFANGPRVHEYIREMNGRVLSRHDLITVGETPFTQNAQDLLPYVLPSRHELNMVFQFELMSIDSYVDPFGTDVPLVPKQWKLKDLKDVVTRWQTFEREAGFWNAVFIENHDHSRSVSRFGNDSPDWRTLSAKLLAMLEITQSGTLYIYQGQEIGMKNAPPTWGLEEYKDVATQNFWNSVLEKRKRETKNADVDMSDVMDGIRRKARDHARLPMQWDSSAYAGFSPAPPWMRVNDDYPDWNAEVQLEDTSSVRSFWKQALTLRKKHNVLVYGDFTLRHPDNSQVFAYTRSLGSATALVLLNFHHNPTEFKLDDVPHLIGGPLVLGNYPTADLPTEATEAVRLRGYEGRLYFSSSVHV
ncbi:glycoside hydrolase family 13 protein [Gloeophyllum trabeum ATCC 11539]|uniref:Glycoside hydrolase family 13 protein n=1 Tax=Gloeophyllum trabeum (strain ATCC 11539 / FP-39264 / Madison 617) TaxID=670483 RepID=S7PVU1_GLOTA|nr:glycoside hydrolase family 13 protein [Gloeophyllum trabeum ATCC 11539]EPQ51633.1 glycoside hydrolase family 13 protein [Gloeophyllum trabeum ATCC 11539]